MKSKLFYIDLDKEIGVRITRFPDGQQTLQLNHEIQGDVVVKCSLNSFNKLELLACLTTALGARRIAKLFIPYMFGARSDRRFTEDGINYFGDVFLPLLTKCVMPEYSVHALPSLTTLDIHNPLAMRAYWGPMWVDDVASAYIRRAIQLAAPDSLLFPDLGARKRNMALIDSLGIPANYAEKTRDVNTGSITGMKLIVDNPFGRKVLVIDDLCDGGATFVNLLPLIPEECAAELYVTHGIFSKGFSELMGQTRRYKRIITTDSFKSVETLRNESMCYSSIGAAMYHNITVLEVAPPNNFLEP